MDSTCRSVDQQWVFLYAHVHCLSQEGLPLSSLQIVLHTISSYTTIKKISHCLLRIVENSFNVCFNLKKMSLEIYIHWDKIERCQGLRCVCQRRVCSSWFEGWF